MSCQVTFVDDLDSMDPPFSVLGPLVSNNTDQYPEKVNAEFAQVHYLLTSTSIIYD